MTSTTAPAFKDLGKNATESLTKGFPTTFKVEVTTAQQGLTFVNSLERKRGKKDTDADFVFGLVQPKFKQDKYGFEFNGTLDTDGAVKGDFIFKDLFSCKGLKTTLKTNVAAEQSVEASLEFAHPLYNAGSTLVYKSGAPLKLSGSAVFSIQGFNGGFSSSYVLPSDSTQGLVEKLEVAANYKKDAFDVTAFARNEKKTDSDKWTVGGNLHYSVNKDTSLISTFETDPCNLKGVPNVCLGAAWKYEGYQLKAKTDTKGIVALSVAQNLSSALQYTLGSEIDTNNLVGNSHKFGLSLSVKP